MAIEDMDKLKIRVSQPRWLALIALLCASKAAMGLEVKSITVESQLMRFPGISLDGINYGTIDYEYAQQGDSQVIALERETETLTCNGNVTQNPYLRVRYQGPDIIFRITDRRRDRVLLLQALDTTGSVEFASGQCNHGINLEMQFSQQKALWLNNLNQQLLSGAQEKMKAFIQADVALSYESLMFPLFYFERAGNGLNEANLAFDQARVAFDLNLEFGLTQEAREQLSNAADVWQAKAQQISQAARLSANDQRVLLALYRNLTVVQLFLANFEQARRCDALAMARGMPADESLQPIILSHERRYILSPLVAADLVLTANLYRFGQNAVREAQVSEVKDFAQFKQALSQN